MLLVPLQTEAGENLVTEDANRLVIEPTSSIRLLTESLDALVAESGDHLVQEAMVAELEASSDLTANLYVPIGYNLRIYSESSLIADLTVENNLKSDAVAEVTLSSSITTLVLPKADLQASSNLNSDATTQIPITASLAVETTASSSINTFISLASVSSSDASTSGDITTKINLETAPQTESTVSADLRTSIDAFASFMAVSNVANARLTITSNIYSEIAAPYTTLLAEDGSYLLAESGEHIVESGSARLGGLLGSIVNLDSSIYLESLSTADLTAHILLSSAASSVAFAESQLNTQISLSLSAAALSSTVAALTTSLKIEAPISVSPSLEPNLSTHIILRSSTSASATFSSALSNGIKLAFSGSATPTLSAPITTKIPLNSSSSSASSALQSGITTSIRAATALNANAVFNAELKTSINALTSLIGVSNFSDAALTVYRVTPNYAPLDQTIYLAELQAYDPDTSSVITWRFSSGHGYNNSGQFYAPRIEQPATLSRSMGGSRDNVGGRASVSYGELTLVNSDGGLNDMAGDFFDGRTLILKRGNPELPYATFTTILAATVESVAMERERISVRLRDKAVTLDTAFSTAKYAGTNVLPSGIEGTADDIKGQSKPRIFGRIALMSPILVNTSKLIYQVNDGAVDNIINVYDAGAYLTRSTDYASQSEMEANAPASGTWRAWPAGGCVRLGSSPYGQVSVCVAEKWDYTQISAAAIIKRILTEKGYITTDWVEADFTALNKKNAASVGVIVSDGETTAALIDRICQSVGAWWGFDSLGRFRIARLDAPAGVASATLTDNQILTIERQPENSLPIWQSTLKADMNYVVQDKKSLAGVVPANRVAWLELESRDQKVEDSSVKTKRLLADDITYESVLNSTAVAQAESQRRLNLFSARRDTVDLTIANPHDYYSSIDLGSVINVQTKQLGYDSGKKLVVTSVAIDYQANSMDITAWG